MGGLEGPPGRSECSGFAVALLDLPCPATDSVLVTAEIARAEGALALQGFWYLSSLAPPPPEFSDARLKELTARVWGGRTYDELDAIGGFLIGAPDQVAAKGAHLEAIGVDTLLLVCSFGNASHAQACRTLELFAAAVIRSRQSAAR